MRPLAALIGASTALSATFLVLIVLAILADFALRHLGLSVVIGLERIGYLLLASVLAALPGLSRAGGHIALQWGGKPSPLRTRSIAALTAGLCLVLGLRYADLARDAWHKNAHFRQGLDVPEAPVWAAAALAFGIAGLAAFSRNRT